MVWSPGNRTENLWVARRFVEEVVNEPNVDHLRDALDELVAEDVVMHSLGTGTESRGRDVVAKQLTDWRRAVPDYEATIEDVVVHGDEVVLFLTVRGTPRRRFDVLVPTGRSFEVSAVHKVHVEDGKVVGWWRLTNALGMLRQLDLLPESPRKMIRQVSRRVRARLPAR